MAIGIEKNSRALKIASDLVARYGKNKALVKVNIKIRVISQYNRGGKVRLFWEQVKEIIKVQE